MCQNSLPSGVGRSLGAKISGGRVRPWKTFFGFYKTRHILLSNGANCTVLRAVVLTQYRCVTDRTDGRTDGRTELLQLIQRLQCEHCARCKKSMTQSEHQYHIELYTSLVKLSTINITETYNKEICCHQTCQVISPRHCNDMIAFITDCNLNNSAT